MPPAIPNGNFALGFALLCLFALWLMRREWTGGGAPGASGFGAVLSDAIARRLLIVALMNAAPVAVSSTLFLFYVESVLKATGGWGGAAAFAVLPRRRGHRAGSGRKKNSRAPLRAAAHAAFGHGAGHRLLFPRPDARPRRTRPPSR